LSTPLTVDRAGAGHAHACGQMIPATGQLMLEACCPLLELKVAGLAPRSMKTASAVT